MQDTIETVYTGDITITKFSCGCVWRWWVGEPSPRNNQWEKQCDLHAAQERPDNCRCLTIGDDNGATTCWPHHDCFRGDCTHMDND